METLKKMNAALDTIEEINMPDLVVKATSQGRSATSVLSGMEKSLDDLERKLQGQKEPVENTLEEIQAEVFSKHLLVEKKEEQTELQPQEVTSPSSELDSELIETYRKLETALEESRRHKNRNSELQEEKTNLEEQREKEQRQLEAEKAELILGYLGELGKLQGEIGTLREENLKIKTEIKVASNTSSSGAEEALRGEVEAYKESQTSMEKDLEEKETMLQDALKELEVLKRELVAKEVVTPIIENPTDKESDKLIGVEEELTDLRMELERCLGEIDASKEQSERSKLEIEKYKVAIEAQEEEIEKQKSRIDEQKVELEACKAAVSQKTQTNDEKKALDVIIKLEAELDAAAMSAQLSNEKEEKLLRTRNGLESDKMRMSAQIEELTTRIESALNKEDDAGGGDCSLQSSDMEEELKEALSLIKTKTEEFEAQAAQLSQLEKEVEKDMETKVEKRVEGHLQTVKSQDGGVGRIEDIIRLQKENKDLKRELGERIGSRLDLEVKLEEAIRQRNKAERFMRVAQSTEASDNLELEERLKEKSEFKRESRRELEKELGRQMELETEIEAERREKDRLSRLLVQAREELARSQSEKPKPEDELLEKSDFVDLRHQLRTGTIKLKKLEALLVMETETKMALLKEIDTLRRAMSESGYENHAETTPRDAFSPQDEILTESINQMRHLMDVQDVALREEVIKSQADNHLLQEIQSTVLHQLDEAEAQSNFRLEEMQRLEGEVTCLTAECTDYKAMLHKQGSRLEVLESRSESNSGELEEMRKDLESERASRARTEDEMNMVARNVKEAEDERMWKAEKEIGGLEERLEQGEEANLKLTILIAQSETKMVDLQKELNSEKRQVDTLKSRLTCLQREKSELASSQISRIAQIEANTITPLSDFKAKSATKMIELTTKIDVLTRAKLKLEEESHMYIEEGQTLSSRLSDMEEKLSSLMVFVRSEEEEKIKTQKEAETRLRVACENTDTLTFELDSARGQLKDMEELCARHEVELRLTVQAGAQSESALEALQGMYQKEAQGRREAEAENVKYGERLSAMELKIRTMMQKMNHSGSPIGNHAQQNAYYR